MMSRLIDHYMNTRCRMYSEGDKMRVDGRVIMKNFSLEIYLLRGHLTNPDFAMIENLYTY